jgi:hypothetical protein
VHTHDPTLNETHPCYYVRIAYLPASIIPHPYALLFLFLTTTRGRAIDAPTGRHFAMDRRTPNFANNNHYNRLLCCCLYCCPALMLNNPVSTMKMSQAWPMPDSFQSLIDSFPFRHEKSPVRPSIAPCQKDGEI